MFIPFRLYDYEGREDVTKPIARPLPRNVSFQKAEIKAIDHENKKVETDNGAYAYDWLVCALGCHIAPEEIDGMQR